MRRWVLPLFLILAFALGGSAQGIAGKFVLQIVAIAILAAAYFSPREAGYRDARALVVLGWAGAGLIALQLVPLPPAVWHLLPGHGAIAKGDALLGIPAPWRPLSLTPESSLGTLVDWTIFLAVVAFGLRRSSLERGGIVAVIVASGLLGSLLGIAQRSGIAPHLYPFSSTGPTGQFANTNHLATLALACVPMIAALAARPRNREAPGSTRLLALVGVAILVVTIVLTGAVAMIVLIVPTLFASLLIAVDLRNARRFALACLPLMSLAAIVAFWSGGLEGQHVDVSTATRLEIWHRAIALSPFMISGAGFGSFESLYHMVEDPFLVDRFYVNHAHNDLLELAIEGGIPALFLLAAALWWIARATIRAWRQGLHPDPYAQAASIVLAVLLFHSLVDFPLRTLAHLALLASCLVLLATSRPARPVQEEGDWRPTRHRLVT